MDELRVPFQPLGKGKHARHLTVVLGDHPGLLHMYIHLMEMSPTPEAALNMVTG
jgi:hypothetical protein